MFKIFRRCKVLLVNTSEHHFTMPKSPRLCKMLCKSGVKKNQVPENQTLDSCICRDYWTRTSDLAPPRRVRYQLR